MEVGFSSAFNLATAERLRVMDQPEETPSLPARFYRQKATEARRAAEGVTTPAVKKRLEGLAREFDRLADAADSAPQMPDLQVQGRLGRSRR